jgi:hypothetical protein
MKTQWYDDNRRFANTMKRYPCLYYPGRKQLMTCFVRANRLLRYVHTLHNTCLE